MLLAAAKIRAVGTEPATTAVAPPPTMHSETILTTIALVVTVLPRVLLRLRLRLSAPCYERR